jgi:hypothetical protein
VFDTIQVKQDRPRPDAIAELEEIAAGLSDLLAEVTEILTGFHQGDLEEPEPRRLAGADETLITARLEAGRRWAAIARRMPRRGPAAASARQWQRSPGWSRQATTTPGRPSIAWAFHAGP